MRTGEETTHSRQKFWGRYFRFYDTLNKKKPYRHMIEWEVSLLDLEPGCKVLDAGTGSGNVAAELENRGADVMGIDFCEPALDLCRQKAPRGQFQFGDLTKPLEFEDGAFDRVVCSVVLHLFKPEQQEFALREIETLRQHLGEHSLASTLLSALQYSFDTVRFLYYVGKIRKDQQMGEYHFFDDEGLTAALHMVGFKVEKPISLFADQCLAVASTKPNPEAGKG